MPSNLDREKIRDQTDALFDMAATEAEEASKNWSQYLLLVNAGGSAAVLAFLGTNKGGVVPTDAKLTLAGFVIGLVLVGISRSLEFQRSKLKAHRIIPLWTKLRLSDDIPSLEEFRAALSKSSRETRLEFIADASVWLSFAAMIIALTIGSLWALYG